MKRSHSFLGIAIIGILGGFPVEFMRLRPVPPRVEITEPKEVMPTEELLENGPGVGEFTNEDFCKAGFTPATHIRKNPDGAISLVGDCKEILKKEPDPSASQQLSNGDLIPLDN